MLNIENYRQILTQNNWKTDRSFLPSAVAHWLLTQDSMTQKLQNICTDLNVIVINESWTSQQQWRREVLLQGDGKNWVFAQTDFSIALMKQFEQDIINLGEQPLGYWLFSQKLEREKLEWLLDERSGLYARRSILRINEAMLSVTELFLSDFSFKESI
ncbi:chorismate--pyruvate lyase family protein [Conservatibacter flavescens]|uniref:Chorismate lyase n=1 Tax=Conservatibacter flavescens TaxID=28161 RepID=A0A2M8S0N3_9PAST|nr:chorismate lyase [Conservatibacter flavescens]PJG84710.1 chorismate lyase [Conservatibacter flavescens]